MNTNIKVAEVIRENGLAVEVSIDWTHKIRIVYRTIEGKVIIAYKANLTAQVYSSGCLRVANKKDFNDMWKQAKGILLSKKKPQLREKPKPKKNHLGEQVNLFA